MRHVNRRDPSRVGRGTAAALALGLLVPAAAAQLTHRDAPLEPAVQQAQTWQFDLTTTGQDVAWTSPTNVDPGAAVYASEYQIDLVEVDVQWTFLTINDVDVTDQIPPELQTGASTIPGPAPIVFVDEPIVYPAPPAQPGIAAQLGITLNAAGFGTFSATNVTLGSMQVDLGGVLGVQTVTVKSVRIAGQLTMHAAWFDLAGSLAGTSGAPVLAGDGSLKGGDPITLTLTGALPGSTAALVMGFSTLSAPFKGGTLVPNPDLLILGLPTGPAGVLPLAGVWPTGLPAGFALVLQMWVVDAGGPAGFAATNALRAVTP